MTDLALGRAPAIPRSQSVRDVTPASGWLSLVLVVAMSVILALAIDDARVILGHGEWTDMLAWAAIAGALIGSLGPSIGWGRWTTYLIGSIAAALLVPLMAGASLPDPADSPAGWFQATAEAAWAAARDLIVLQRGLTAQIGHHMLILGLWVWASAMFAGYAVFGHRRPLNAVLLLGVLLILNASVTFNDQLVYFVLFTLAALFLLIRSHTFEEQADWLRRRIGDPSAISALYLRGGAIFIAITVGSALLLTNIAKSAPLAGVWTDLGAQVVDWTRGLSGVLPQSGTGPALAPEFGPKSLVRSNWVTNDQPVFTITLAPADRNYEGLWRERAYDILGWSWFDTSEPIVVERAAGDPLLEGSGEASGVPTRDLIYTITPAQRRPDIITTAIPAAVDIAVREETLGEGRWFSAIEGIGDASAYAVTAKLPLEGDANEGLTANKLRRASTDYDPELEAFYAQPLDRTTGIIGPAFDAVEATIDAMGADNPYDRAVDIVTHLQDPDEFDYAPDIGGVCGERSMIECFAAEKVGFCQYYAALMTALMREEGYAARVAQGFQTGNADDASGTRRTIRNDASHAWVEVYFPGYGWIPFDPTGGGIGQAPDLPPGADVDGATPRPSATLAPRPSESEPTLNEPGFRPPVTGSGAPVGPFIAIALVLAAVVGALAFITWRRGPRGPVTAEGAYGMVTRMAARFGFGPRPNQTVYEYAGSLAEVLPEARPQLQTVAAAKVEVAYSGRKLGVDRMLALREAQRRLRMTLLRLAFRRDARKRRRAGG